MKKINIKNTIISALSAFIILTPKIARAGLGDELVGDVFSFVSKAVGTVISIVLGWAVTLSGLLLDAVLKININLIGPETEIVSVGWAIARDIANLGFVLAIILIAVATIVRYKDYGAKKLLPRLIAAAIIVNFSLAIAMAFVNFSHVITNFFIEDRIGLTEGFSMSASLSQAFGPQRLFISEIGGEAPPPTPLQEEGSIGGGITMGVVMTLGQIVFSIVFLILIVVTYLALALMLLIRFVVLTILLILAPIAWLFWVIPKLENNFSKWWNAFLKWTMFAPAVSFFIYLTLLSGDALKSIPIEAGSGFDGGLVAVISQGSQMIVISAMLFGGLVAANSIGITTAKGAKGAAEGAVKGAGKWMKSKPKNIIGGAKKAWEEGKAGGAGAAAKQTFKSLRSSITSPVKEGTKSLTPEGVEKPESLFGSAIMGARKGVGSGKKKNKKKKECPYCSGKFENLDNHISTVHSNRTGEDQGGSGSGGGGPQLVDSQGNPISSE